MSVNAMDSSKLLEALLAKVDFSQAVYDQLKNEVETDPYQFVNDSEVEISEKDISIAAESVFEGFFGEFDLEVNDEVYKFISGLDVSDLVELVEEQIKGDKSFYDDPLGYYGMKQSDFI